MEFAHNLKIGFVDDLKNVSTEEKRHLCSWIEDNAMTISDIAHIRNIFQYIDVLPLDALAKLVNEAVVYYLGCTSFPRATPILSISSKLL
jgi:hypothetical protein